MVSDVRHALVVLLVLAMAACGPPGDGSASGPVEVADTHTEAAELFTPSFDADQPFSGEFEAPSRHASERWDPQGRPIQTWRREVEDPNADRMPSADRLPSNPAAEADPCADRCGADAMCRFMCANGELPDDGGGFEDRAGPEPMDEDEFVCLICGRETGFLGAPENLVASAEDDRVSLRWDAVDGADKYAVHGMLIRDGGPAALVEASYLWVTEDTELTVTLETGLSYTFYVVAWDAEGKTRSSASRPVRIDL